MKSITFVSLFLLTAYFLTGCTAAVVGGAAVGTSVALDKRTTGNFVEDQNIKAKFTHLYYQDKVLSKQTHVNVTSYNLQVLITGEVPLEQQKQKLSDIANQIKNVRYHYNEVIVGQPTSFSSRSNDSYLTSKIKTAVFTNIKELDGAQVKVVTENGSVFLMGLVSRKQGDQITEIARTTRGVKRVIKLFEYPKPDDKRI
ncbi:MAG: BON domain-containing protein [Gammaproteobacteria bacterium]|nr:BON domain-containing protein [Gammaproteobacteria bacterium]